MNSEGNFLLPKFFRFKIIVPFHKIGLIGWARQALKNGQKKAKYSAALASKKLPSDQPREILWTASTQVALQHEQRSVGAFEGGQ